jgi:RNA polymerase sigma-70 factor, ECF subfamily
MMDARLPFGAAIMTKEPLKPYAQTRERFEDLYRREFPGLYAVATALSGPAESEDLVQDTMFKAFVNWERVGRLERPGGWCHRVLVNSCRSSWHKRIRQRRILQHYRSDDIVDGPSADVIAFWQAVRELPSRPRTAITLYYAADRTTAEIASILDVPEGTVRSDLSRARHALAAQLGV